MGLEGLLHQYQRLTGDGLTGLESSGQRLVGRLMGDSPFFVDFDSPQARARMRDARKTSVLKRLEGLLSPSRRILDLTMGFAQDDREFLLLGVNVFAQERSPVIFSLTLDAFLNQAGFSTEGKIEWLAAQKRGWIAPPKRLGAHPDEGAFSLRCSQALDDLASMDLSFAYYDPMFSLEERSALPKKNIQFLLRVVGHDADQEDFFARALATGLPIVVKRQAGALPVINSPKPRRQYQTKLVRLDVYESRLS
ncbi:MAG: class I SAM-dependent methyltransferase [Bdellovibrionales bacterium]|nr:class I SAM-dependent methyltransferase [Bdellovibrionales bacterium]